MAELKRKPVVLASPRREAIITHSRVGLSVGPFFSIYVFLTLHHSHKTSGASRH